MARGIEDILTDRRVLDWGDKIITLEPEASPLLTVTKKLGREKADNQKYTNFEDRPYQRWFYVGTVTGSAPLTGLKLEVVENDTDYDGAAAYINVGDLLWCPVQDHTMRVTAVDTSTGEITVTGTYAGRGEGGDNRLANSSDVTSDSHSDPTDGQRVLKLSNTFPDGGASAVAHSIALTQVYNFIQKQKDSFDVDEEVMLSELNGGPELDRLQTRKAIEHAKNIEYQLLLGDRDARIVSGKWQYTSAGLFHSGLTEDSIATADFTESAWRSYLRSCFTNVKGGSKHKVGIFGGQIMEAADKWGQGRVVINDKLSAVLGFAVGGYVTTFGKLDMIFHPMLEEYLEGWGVVFDVNYLKVKTFGSDTVLQTAIQASDYDERKDQYITRCGLKIGMIECHRIIKIT